MVEVAEGNFVSVLHGDGTFARYWPTAGIAVSNGQEVQAGDPLGQTGALDRPGAWPAAGAEPQLDFGVFAADEDGDVRSLPIRFDDGTREELSEREAALLKYLAANAGRAISRDEILTRVWRLDPRGLATRTIDMHVARLREKLHDDPSEPSVILTVRGTGYMFAERRASG